MKINKIKPNPNNPRLIKDLKFLKLVKSLLTFPEMIPLRPIILDENNMILGGNMRYKALKHILTLDVATELSSFELDTDRLAYLNEYWDAFKDTRDVEILQAKDLTDEQKKEFIIKDNVSFGDNDWDILANEWNDVDLQDWGLDIPTFGGFEAKEGDYSEDFTLPEGDKAPFQQMTFTLADEQAEYIKTAMAAIKQTDEYKYCETFGNENSNGNSLYLIVSQWDAQKK